MGQRPGAQMTDDSTPESTPSVDRRTFMAAAGIATAAAAPALVQTAAAAEGTSSVSTRQVGGDYMVDVIRSLDVK